MASQNAAKPATARHGEPASEIELLGGGLDARHSPKLNDRQALALTRRCAISFAMASIVVPLIHGEAR
ncbi:hypothetical protein HZZ16_32935 [Bradyrhizobium sp. CNPSo 4016]|nr:hypothetical protein [Bradyrhizobium glycinis]